MLKERLIALEVNITGDDLDTDSIRNESQEFGSAHTVPAQMGVFRKVLSDAHAAELGVLEGFLHQKQTSEPLNPSSAQALNPSTPPSCLESTRLNTCGRYQ